MSAVISTYYLKNDIRDVADQMGVKLTTKQVDEVADNLVGDAEFWKVFDKCLREHIGIVTNKL